VPEKCLDHIDDRILPIQEREWLGSPADVAIVMNETTGRVVVNLAAELVVSFAGLDIESGRLTNRVGETIWQPYQLDS